MTVTGAPATATERFLDVMSEHATSVAVVSARRADGTPGGLLVSSLCSYSARPPSLLVAVDAASRSYPMMVACRGFGVHLLGDGDAALARTFASRSPDKFAGLDWRWDDDVPRIGGVNAYLRCRVTAVFPHGDHAVVIGEVDEMATAPGPPLVHYRRRLGWTLS